MNNKLLYNKIMRSVSSSVKKYINESFDDLFCDIERNEFDDASKMYDDNMNIYSLQIVDEVISSKSLTKLLYEKLLLYGYKAVDSKTLKKLIGIILETKDISYDLSWIDVSNVTNMDSMFILCEFPEGFDISQWNTSNVTDMSYMFNWCTLPKGFDISQWNTSNVTDMSYMFNWCTLPEGFDVSLWNVSKVTNMQWIFSDCTFPECFDISQWVVSSVTNMDSMFRGCKLPRGFDISQWDVSNVTNMLYMFSNSNLEYKYGKNGEKLKNKIV